ncbi:shikimate kinase [bacterium]|nr:shikimate kinase [bacterium]
MALEHRNIRNLALIGFMGTGKSTAGQLAAKFLDLQYRDTDQLIEAEAGQSIPQIFNQVGEEGFRKLETRIIQGLANESGLVISTGGGVGASPEHMDSLKKHAFVICLWAKPETILRRVSSQGNRPLLECDDPKSKILELLAERAPFYKQADVLLNTELRPLRDVASLLCRHFRDAQADCRKNSESVA